RSPLWHSICTESILITKDDQIVLTKSVSDKGFKHARSTRSASVEEQMLRRHRHSPHIRDKHPFDAAVRGIREELGVNANPNETRLLMVGLGFGNFAAVFLFVLFCAISFEEVVEAFRASNVRDDAEAMYCLQSAVD